MTCRVPAQEYSEEMPTFQITALAPVTISAYVWYKGSRPMARDHQGNSMPPMAAVLNQSETFRLGPNQSRDDIAFLETVESGSVSGFFQGSLPEELHQPIVYKSVLKIERINHDKPPL